MHYFHRKSFFNQILKQFIVCMWPDWKTQKKIEISEETVFSPEILKKQILKIV